VWIGHNYDATVSTESVNICYKNKQHIFCKLINKNTQTLFKINILPNDQKSKGCAKIIHFLLVYYLNDLNLIPYTNHAYMKYYERQLMQYYSSINSVCWEQSNSLVDDVTEIPLVDDVTEIPWSQPGFACKSTPFLLKVAREESIHRLARHLRRFFCRDSGLATRWNTACTDCRHLCYLGSAGDQAATSQSPRTWMSAQAGL
jgi:hypothetical protein